MKVAFKNTAFKVGVVVITLLILLSGVFAKLNNKMTRLGGVFLENSKTANVEDPWGNI